MAFGVLKGYGDIPIEQERIGVDWNKKKVIFEKKGIVGAMPYYEFVGIE